MTITVKYSPGQLVVLKNTDQYYVVKSVNISITGDVLTHKENIIYEIEGPCSGKRIVVKEDQIHEN